MRTRTTMKNYRNMTRRSLLVAVVIGTLLNLINHYDLLLNPDFTTKVVFQMVLTYMVPFFVSMHGQLSTIKKA